MNFNRFFNSQAKTITFAAFLLAISALISRFLGLFRDRLLAGHFGAGQELDAYFLAFRIPDFIYGILIMGGVSVIFLPVFAEYFKKSEKEGWLLSNIVLNCFLVLLIVFCGILAILTPWLIKLIAPGFDLTQRDLAVSLTRIMFLSPIFFGLSSIFSGILHYFNRFLAYSLAPILYNLGIIFGIIFFVPIFGVMGLVYGVILGAFSHWAIQIPAAHASGFRYMPVFNFRYPGLLKIFKFMTWRVIGASVYNINLIVITAIASTLTIGSIAVFNFANNLSYFPIGIIGASFAMAAFPALSRAWATGAKEEFLEHFSSTFRQILFLVIPVSLLIFLFRVEIVQLILGVGRFGWPEVQLTSASLGLFSLGIFALTLAPFLLRLFFSLQDVRIPTIIGLIYMVLTIVTSLLFVWLLAPSSGGGNFFQEFMQKLLNLNNIENIQVVGLPLAVSLSAIVYFSLLSIFLRKKMGDIRLGEIWHSLRKIIFASVLMVLVVYILLHPSLARVGDEGGFFNNYRLILAAFFGPLVYLLAAYFFRSPELKIIKNSIFKQ
jgi:putative peptidoglycan lipid II flippase